MTNIDELVIDRANFQQNRRAYGITLAEIADKCKISSSVISNFENFTGKYTQTRVRDDNQRTIVRALKDLIQEKIDSVFYTNEQKVNNNNKEKENEIMSEATKEITLTELAESVVKEREKQNNKKGNNSYFLAGYNKESIVPKLRKYCKENNLGMTEFCDMCDISRTMLSPYYIKVAPVMREDILKKICNATGLDIGMFNEDRNDGNILKENKIKETNIIEKENNNGTSKMIEKSIEKKIIETKPISTEIIKDNIEIRDKKYTFQDGEYYEEYIEIKHIRKPIGKEDFLKAIQAAS